MTATDQEPSPGTGPDPECGEPLPSPRSEPSAGTAPTPPAAAADALPTESAADAPPTESTDDASPAAATNSPPRDATTAPLAARLLGPDLGGPVVALAMVVTLVIVMARSSLFHDDEQPSGRPRPTDGPAASSTFAPDAHGGRDEKSGARELLARAASAAERRADPDPRDAEFTYVRSKSAVLTAASDEAACAFIEPLRQRQIWRSVDGTRTGLLRTGQVPTEPIRLDPAAPAPVSLAYRHLQRLPRDPAALLRTLHTSALSGRADDQQVFRTIGGLIAESVLPPATEAALYRAAARLPGVVAIRDAVDAVGRHGAAVARVDERTGEREEWLFDRRNATLLGVRVVMVDPEKAPEATREDCQGPQAGVVTSTTAVLARAIVARPDERPRGEDRAG
ncbi:CU044_5270 family protein [Streptomyces sp. 796.1]|uniref:CU044_5270 family protein n=1 Tax=Streptomyces sp. 796.1 TaxID=3163029 RepID=UPI0039C8C513